MYAVISQNKHYFLKDRCLIDRILSEKSYFFRSVQKMHLSLWKYSIRTEKQQMFNNFFFLSLTYILYLQLEYLRKKCI